MKIWIVLVLLLTSYIPVPVAAQPGNDAALFTVFFKAFKTAVGKNNPQQQSAMLHYPFYTNRDEAGNGQYTPSDPITAAEFPTYRKMLFHADVIRLIPGVTGDELSEINLQDKDSYYRELRKITDKGSKLYEAYLQYPQHGSGAESWFAFVFGKVKGKYEVIAYYGKWPVKDP